MFNFASLIDSVTLHSVYGASVVQLYTLCVAVILKYILNIEETTIRCKMNSVKFQENSGNNNCWNMNNTVGGKFKDDFKKYNRDVKKQIDIK